MILYYNLISYIDIVTCPNTGHLAPLTAAVRPLMWRNTKAIVSREGAVLPPRTLKVGARAPVLKMCYSSGCIWA